MARGGARPNSGPKPIAEQVCRLNDIARCWDVVMEYINSDAPLEKRAEMAKYIASKAIPQNIQFSLPEDTNKITFTVERSEISNRLSNYPAVN